MGRPRKPDAPVTALARESSEAAPFRMEELLKLLRFAPREGRIWLDDQRMVMLHLTALSALRRQLVDTIGTDAARTLLTRIGYSSGTTDASLALRRQPPGDPMFTFMAGPMLHGVEGLTVATPIALDVDVQKRKFYGEFRWDDSAEVDAHLAAYGLSPDPVCWMMIGYASGYCTAYMGWRILFREVECRAMGAHHCRIIGKPTEEWQELGDDARIYDLDPVVVAPGRPARSQLAVSGRVPASADPRQPDLPQADRGQSDRGQPDRGQSDPGALVGISSGFLAVCQKVDKVAHTNATVLLTGETGVGKEMFARALHRLSSRASGNFVAVNCSAIPETLIEADLFGVQKGAFTGAIASRPGRFEHADGGTVFLDEVGTLSHAAQAKFLRVLQEREVERVGDLRVRKVDVRVIAATNDDLAAAVADGRFRADLYFRLNVFPIIIPPLRDRRDDIPVLLSHFLDRFAARHARHVTGYTERAVDALLRYDYPGNIRELENMVERAVILADDNAPLDIGHLFAHAPSFMTEFLRMTAGGQIGVPGRETGGLRQIAESALACGVRLEEIEPAIVELAVAQAGGNLTEAGRKLGITRAQVAYRLKEHS